MTSAADVYIGELNEIKLKFAVKYNELHAAFEET